MYIQWSCRCSRHPLMVSPARRHSQGNRHVAILFTKGSYFWPCCQFGKMNENGTSYVLPIFLWCHCIVTREHGLKYMKGTEANGVQELICHQDWLPNSLSLPKNSIAWNPHSLCLYPTLKISFLIFILMPRWSEKKDGGYTFEIRWNVSLDSII